MARISVIVPSRLAVNPTSENNRLWLDRALMSVKRQTVFAEHEWEFIVGLDANAPWPPERFSDVKFVRSTGAGQALAVNAAAAHATGDLFAFLEDDDVWYPEKIAAQLELLEHGFEFVSCSSREIDEHANFIRVNDFAGPSGWLMKRHLWEQAGPMDESFRWHVDTEWLGRLNALFPAAKRRAHISNDKRQPDGKNWLTHVAKHSAIFGLEGPEPLVGRLVNPAGGMARIASDPEAAAQSREEHGRMFERFKEIPW